MFFSSFFLFACAHTQPNSHPASRGYHLLPLLLLLSTLFHTVAVAFGLMLYIGGLPNFGIPSNTKPNELQVHRTSAPSAAINMLANIFSMEFVGLSYNAQMNLFYFQCKIVFGIGQDKDWIIFDVIYHNGVEMYISDYSVSMSRVQKMAVSFLTWIISQYGM